MKHTDQNKAVIVIDADLPLGLIANTAAVLALTLGQRIERLIGPDLKDASGHCHTGITTMPLPVLKGSTESLAALRARADEAGVFVVDFSDAAQSTTTYAAYAAKLAAATTVNLRYLGIALYGNSKAINRLTGSMPLLR